MMLLNALPSRVCQRRSIYFFSCSQQQQQHQHQDERSYWVCTVAGVTLGCPSFTASSGAMMLLFTRPLVSTSRPENTLSLSEGASPRSPLCVSLFHVEKLVDQKRNNTDGI